MGWIQNWQARRLRAKQHAKLMEHASIEVEKTGQFLHALGERMRTESLPPRCPAIYEMILDWCGDNSIKRKQAALYLFLWEVEEKKRAIQWEVADIDLELEQMHHETLSSH
jgi:hypothetical protein